MQTCYLSNREFVRKIPCMVTLDSIVSFCERRTRNAEIKDFPPAKNGLQIQNGGSVSKIGAAVDAGKIPFEKAVAAGVDFLIVHHGLYWAPPEPLISAAYEKVRLALQSNLAVYSSHLPLDCHPEIGNNALLAKALGLVRNDSFLPYEGTDIGLIASAPPSRMELRERLGKLFPAGVTSIEYGSERPRQIAILTGSGSSAVDCLKEAGVDTLITGELKQNFFNTAQEKGLNLYLCGHYRTEVFGVEALGREVARYFNLPFEFIGTDCPL